MSKNNNFLSILDADIKGATNNGTPTTATKTADRFPLEVLPPRAVAYIEALEDANGIPPDFMAPAMLWTCATATGNAVHIELKPGTRYAPILFLALIGLPNANKSQALKTALGPVFDADRQTYESYKEAFNEYKAAQGMSKAERRQSGLDDIPKPIFSKTILNDVTPEALAAAHSGRLRGISVYYDELAAWFKRFDRYADNGDAETWLSLWTGTVLSVDRKTTDSIYITSPFVNVCGTLQPSVLERLAADGRGQNGFLDRLLFAWPDGITKPLWQMQGLDLSLRDAYTKAIGRLIEIDYNENDGPIIITLAPDARQRLFDWYNNHNKKLCDNADNELLQGLHGKMDIHAARLILTLHLLRYAYNETADLPTEIDATTVADGIRVAEYFRTHSLKVNQRIFNTDPVAKLPRDRQRLYDALPEQFKTADGIAIAKNHNVRERTFKQWIAKESALFVKLSHGVYFKVL